MKGTLLLVDGPQDAGLKLLIDQAASKADFQIATWTPGGGKPMARPTAILVGLGRGARRMPANLSQLADHQFPDVPVILLSEEPLIQPLVLLAGGRISLLGQTTDAGLLTERLLAAGQWRTDTSKKPEFSLRRSEVRVGRIRASLLLAEGPGAPADRLETSQSHGLTAIITAHGDRPLAINQEIMPAIDAWQDQPDSDQLRRSFAVRGSGIWQTLVHIDPDAQRWLLSAPHADALLVLASAQRFPTWWRVTDQGDGPIRVLDAAPGDLILATSPLPATPEFAAAHLAERVLGGAGALIDHLAAASIAISRPVAAVVIEVGS